MPIVRLLEHHSTVHRNASFTVLESPLKPISGLRELFYTTWPMVNHQRRSPRVHLDLPIEPVRPLPITCSMVVCAVLLNNEGLIYGWQLIHSLPIHRHCELELLFASRSPKCGLNIDFLSLFLVSFWVTEQRENLSTAIANDGGLGETREFKGFSFWQISLDCLKRTEDENKERVLLIASHRRGDTPRDLVSYFAD